MLWKGSNEIMFWRLYNAKNNICRVYMAAIGKKRVRAVRKHTRMFFCGGYIYGREWYCAARFIAFCLPNWSHILFVGIPFFAPLDGVGNPSFEGGEERNTNWKWFHRCLVAIELFRICMRRGVAWIGRLFRDCWGHELFRFDGGVNSSRKCFYFPIVV